MQGEATKQVSTCLPPLSAFTPPAFDVPAFACDAHAHVLPGDPQRYPLVAQRSYMPVACPEDSYLAMLDALGMQRGVLVQISVYGTDNRYMLDVLRRHPDRLRGIAVVAPDISGRELAAMHDAGVRGVRLNVVFGGGVGLDALEVLANKIGPLGWHLQLALHAQQLPELMPRLTKLAVPVVVDHMAHMPPNAGTHDKAFQAFRHLLTDYGWWTKISGAYRLSQQPSPYADVMPLAREIVEIASDRVVWGSDWPHVAVSPMPDTGVLRNLVAQWIPDASTRHKVLVSNPERLYGFPSSDGGMHSTR